jgi:hypothetical protein
MRRAVLVTGMMFAVYWASILFGFDKNAQRWTVATSLLVFIALQVNQRKGDSK